MSFEEWLDKRIDKELANNPELRKVFAEHPERRKQYIQKVIDSDSTDDGLRLRYREETGKK